MSKRSQRHHQLTSPNKNRNVSSDSKLHKDEFSDPAVIKQAFAASVEDESVAVSIAAWIVRQAEERFARRVLDQWAQPYAVHRVLSEAMHAVCSAFVGSALDAPCDAPLLQMPQRVQIESMSRAVVPLLRPRTPPAVQRNTPKAFGTSSSVDGSGIKASAPSLPLSRVHRSTPLLPAADRTARGRMSHVIESREQTSNRATPFTAPRHNPHFPQRAARGLSSVPPQPPRRRASSLLSGLDMEVGLAASHRSATSDLKAPAKGGNTAAARHLVPVRSHAPLETKRGPPRSNDGASSMGGHRAEAFPPLRIGLPSITAHVTAVSPRTQETPASQAAKPPPKTLFRVAKRRERRGPEPEEALFFQPAPEGFTAAVALANMPLQRGVQLRLITRK